MRCFEAMRFLSRPCRLNGVAQKRVEGSGLLRSRAIFVQNRTVSETRFVTKGSRHRVYTVICAKESLTDILSPDYKYYPEFPCCSIIIFPLSRFPPQRKTASRLSEFVGIAHYAFLKSHNLPSPVHLLLAYNSKYCQRPRSTRWISKRLRNSKLS